MKRQQFFKIEELFQQRISDVIDMFQIKVPMFPLIFVTTGQIVYKW